MVTEYQETAIVITVPDAKTGDPSPLQVLVRLPGHIDPAIVQVDFRPDPVATWTPYEFFPNSVRVEHQ